MMGLALKIRNRITIAISQHISEHAVVGRTFHSIQEAISANRGTGIDQAIAIAV